MIAIFLSVSYISTAQKIGIYNEKGKLVHKLKKNKTLDFRVNHSLIYPEKTESQFLESRIYGVIDTIIGTEITLSENQIILNFTETESILVEEDYEYTDLKIDISEIKEVSFTPTMSSIGNALLVVGIAAILASPLVGLGPGGYSTDRVIIAASMGAGSALVGGGLTLAFGQKPVQTKQFDGPPYFKKYQSGSLAVIKE